MKLKDLEELNLITDVNEPDKIWLCKTKDNEFMTMPIGAKTDFTDKCMAAVCCLMNLMAGQDKEISWAVEAGTLTWVRNQ